MMDRPCLRALAQGGLLAALFLVARAASAAPPSDDDATTQRVAALFKRANTLYDDKRLAEAEPLYVEAWRLKKTYDIACNLGAIDLDLGKPREAAEYFAFALREFPAGGKAATLESLKVRLGLARAQVGTLHVRVNVAGAEVSVGSRVIGKAPVDDELFVSPGMVTVSAAAPGYEQAVQSLQVTKGGTAEVVLSLKEPRRSVTPAWVMGGVGAAALVTGAAFIGVAQGKKSTAETFAAQTNHACPVATAMQQGACKQLESAAASGDTFGNTGIGLLVTAGVAAVGATTYLLWPRSHSAPLSGLMHVAPVAGPSGGGVVVVGTF